jgi:hypothetical protein
MAETTVPGPVPAGAVQAAAVALHDLECPDRSCEPQVFAHCFQQARAALEAAWPLLAQQATAAERAAIRQLAADVDARYDEWGFDDAQDYPFTDLIDLRDGAS